MKCASCGGELDAGANACASCGAAVPVANAGAAATSAAGARAVFAIDSSGPATESRFDSVAMPLPSGTPVPPPLPPLGGSGAGRVAGGSGELPDHTDEPGLYAGFWRRVAAYFIDLVVMVLLGLAVGLVLGFIEGLVFRRAIHAINQVAGLVVGWLYFALQESSSEQATLGKRAVGLRVTDLHGEPIGFGRATGRYFGKYLSTLLFCVGFMMAGWTRRKQGLHDMLAGTLVVRNDGLQAARVVGSGDASRRPASGMPGWAIALVAVGAAMVFVVGVLAAIAIPAYQNYFVRSQVAEGMVLAGGAKVAMSEYYANNDGQWPSNNSEAGLAAPHEISGKYVASVDVGDQPGEIVIRFADDEPGVSRDIRGKQLALAGEDVGNGLVLWHCDLSSTTVPDKDLPSSCRRHPSE
jgi:uncharacterized RDD family membrane protein YckC/Tfp pilus assembly major pilin PilA